MNVKDEVYATDRRRTWMKKTGRVRIEPGAVRTRGRKKNDRK